MMYICTELIDDICVTWVNFSSILTMEDALKIGSMLFATTFVAWSLGFLIRFILNR